ncbi:MAG: choice-of-anchor R domain-containing protein [Planctomycetota bacterium]
MKQTLLVGLVAGLAFANFASAQFLGNLPSDPNAATVFNGSSVSNVEARSKAVGFTTPAGVPYELEDVTLLLSDVTSLSPSIPHVAIWSSSSSDGTLGVPETQLFVLDNPALSPDNFPVGVSNFFTFTAGTPFELLPDTSYFLLVNGAIGNQTFFWNAENPAVTPTGPATFDGYRFGISATPPTADSSVFNSFAINATAIPEPATLSTLAIGTLLLGRTRRPRH